MDIIVEIFALVKSPQLILQTSQDIDEEEVAKDRQRHNVCNVYNLKCTNSGGTIFIFKIFIVI